ncbi:MAG: DinB family protein [Ignavibacteria bacterium]|nr:DinB family protein [Ignavibacteria bacterium]
MAIKDAFLAELKQEAESTRKLLERVPMDKPDWAPHAKSMKLGNLANHVAELPGWTMVTLDHDELDFAKWEYKPVIPKTTEELVKNFDEQVSKAVECLNRTTDDIFMQNWTMRMGDKIFFTLPKAAVLRTFTFNHSYHHRAQLGVYLRLLDIPLPGIYGPTADEANM